MLLQGSQSQFSQDKTVTSNTNTQETNKVMGIKDISIRTISSNPTTVPPLSNNNLTKNPRLHPSLAFKNLTKEGKDLELNSHQQPQIQNTNTNNDHSINHSQERNLLKDLTKSGKINQERTNNSYLFRGEIKETFNNSSSNEIPRYLKEKSVRNPTFYPANKEVKQGNTETN